MRSVGIRELKSKLSHYLDQVRKGARLTVTDRGRAIATISPVQASPEVERLMEMVREGRLVWNGGKPRGAQRLAKIRGDRLVSTAILEDRG